MVQNIPIPKVDLINTKDETGCGDQAMVTIFVCLCNTESPCSKSLRLPQGW
jgi:hypothetical protein